MPVYERQGGTNWVKIIVIVGIILLVLVGGCAVIGGIFFTRFAKQMMVSITQTTDASGNAVFDSERFTLTAQAGWQSAGSGPTAILQHSPTGAELTVMGAPKMFKASDMQSHRTGGETKTITLAGASVTEERNEPAGTAQVTLTAPDGQVFIFGLMSGKPFADAETAMLQLLDTIKWK